MQRFDHLKNLVVMASIDGSLTESELRLLSQRCVALGLNEIDLERAIDETLGNRNQLTFPINREEQNRMLADLILMMAADGKLSDLEKRLFAYAAAKMGIERVELDALIDVLVEKRETA